MGMKTITMLDLRKDARRIVQRVKQGERLVLSYRGENSVILEPYHDARNIAKDDLLFKLADMAEQGESMSNSEMDEALYA
jgi:antitoxin (DNA-binding transcriptional repressor) of toxin-antitoxin stability system